MKLITLGAIALAILCWLYPLQALALEIKPNVSSKNISRTSTASNNNLPTITIIPKDRPEVRTITQSVNPTTQSTASVVSLIPSGTATIPKPTKKISGRHSTRAEKQISEEQLRQFLGDSPLAPYSSQILQSPYWSTIIGICTIEEYGCTHYPHNNMGGLMSHGRLIQFNSLADWLDAENRFLGTAETNGRTTIESLNGWYVQPTSERWLKVVLDTKETVENLK